MAQVLTTSIKTEDPQKDGRRWVHLRHVLDDDTVEESSTLIDSSQTPIKLKNARVKAINERVVEEPDEFLTKLDEARDTYLKGDREGAEAVLADAVKVQR